MKFTSENSWEMRLNCGRRMEFQQEFRILSWVYFLPTKTSVKHRWMASKKNIRNYGNEVTTAASSCVPCRGNPGFVQLNVVSWLKMGVVPIFGGVQNLRGTQVHEVHGRHVDFLDNWTKKFQGRKGSFGQASNLAIFGISVEFWPQKNQPMEIGFVLLNVALRLSRESMTRQGKLEVPEISRGEVGWFTLDILMDGFWQQQKSAAWSFWGSF